MRCPQPHMRSSGAPKRRGRRGGGPLAAVAAVEQMEEGRRGRPRACCRPPAGPRGRRGPRQQSHAGARLHAPRRCARGRASRLPSVSARRLRSVGRRSSLQQVGAPRPHPPAAPPARRAEAQGEEGARAARRGGDGGADGGGPARTATCLLQAASGPSRAVAGPRGRGGPGQQSHAGARLHAPRRCARARASGPLSSVCRRGARAQLAGAAAGEAGRIGYY
jgi:hypothetical protein